MLRLTCVEYYGFQRYFIASLSNSNQTSLRAKCALRLADLEDLSAGGCPLSITLSIYYSSLSSLPGNLTDKAQVSWAVVKYRTEGVQRPLNRNVLGSLHHQPADCPVVTSYPTKPDNIYSLKVSSALSIAIHLQTPGSNAAG